MKARVKESNLRKYCQDCKVQIRRPHGSGEYIAPSNHDLGICLKCLKKYNTRKIGRLKELKNTKGQASTLGIVGLVYLGLMLVVLLTIF